jgi:pimeloyl-ACP methyl ester carboxylesterase
MAHEFSYESLRQINAGVLDVGYVDIGPSDGRAVLLLHGWPYDVQTYADVAPVLAQRGFRVLVPHLRGFGTTRFRSSETMRNGQQAALAVDVIAFLDALGLERVLIGGVDWGARAACCVAALWPERVEGLVSVSGYLIGTRAAASIPLHPSEELKWWYQHYFATDRGRLGYETYRREFAKLIWKLASPRWDFDKETFERSAVSLANEDHVSITIHNYRWRLGLAEGERALEAVEDQLASQPIIRVPTISLEGDANGAPHPDPSSYKTKFSGHYTHRLVQGGIGHNLPQEAPDAFVAAIIDVSRT